MVANLSGLGEILKKYRKAYNYSTQQLADTLHVSAGLINNIENAKSDVFKLDLMCSMINELHIPTHEVLTSLFTSSNKSDNYNTLVKEFLDLISFEFIYAISQYEDKEKAVDMLGSWLLSQLDLIKKAKEIS